MFRLLEGPIVECDDSGNVITPKTVGSYPDLDVCAHYICWFYPMASISDQKKNFPEPQ